MFIPVIVKCVGIRADFFYGAKPSLPEKYFDSTRKTAMQTGKTALSDLSHPIIISKNPGFHPLHLAGRNSIFVV